MSQIKLIIAALVLIGFAGLTAAVYKYRGDAAAERQLRVVAEINLKAAADENKRLADRIVDAEEQARVNNEIVLDLANSVARLRAEQLESTKELGDLKGSDDEVRQYLDRPVPAPLRRLLDKRVGIKDDPAPR